MVSFQDENTDTLDIPIVPKGESVDVPDTVPQDCGWTDERGRPVTFPLKVRRDYDLYISRE